MWLVALLACQEPFGTGRHDLVGFRIAAVSAPAAEAGEEIRPSAAFVVDGRPWSPDPVDLAWYWVRTDEDVLAIDPLTPADGFGPAPDLVVPERRRRLALVARRGDQERRAFVDLAPGPPTLPPIEGFVLERLDLDLGAAEGPELLLDARRALEGAPADTIVPGGVARLRAEGDDADGAIVRWMSTAGTWFELDATTADWAAADLWLDGEEIEGEVTPIGAGVVTILGLRVGGDGQTSFRATEVHVGDRGPGVWTRGRWLPTDAPVDWSPGQAVRGTLRADDTSPIGLVLTSPTLEDAATVSSWGTPSLPCLVSRDGPFDPSWLLEQLCGRDAADGVEVVALPEEER